jgi:hypothetical protein
MGSTGFIALASLLAGACGGVLSGLFGIGGGIVLIPLLALALRLDQHQAQGVTLAAMLLPNGLPAVLYFRGQGIRIPWATVGQLTAGFVVAVWAGAKIACWIPESPLRWGFALLLMVMAIRTVMQKSQVPKLRQPGQDLDLAGTWPWALAIGAAGGLASGLLGIGGGLIMVPLLARFLKLTQHEAQAASLTLMLAPIGLPGVWVYAHSGVGLLWVPLAGVAVGFMLGAYNGARIAARLKGARLRQAFAGLMAIMAVLLVLRNF